MVLVYESDPRWYITAESDLIVPPRRRWYALWWEQIQDRYTTTQDPDELVEMIEAAGLDPSGWREPTEDEKRPRRDD